MNDNPPNLGSAPDADFESDRIRSEVRAALFGVEEPLSLGRFRVIARIGAGATGVVYSAWDTRLDRRVALKVIKGRPAENPRAADRLLSEARSAARVQHPSVITVYDAGQADAGLWIAMQFVEGASFAQWLDAEPRGWSDVQRVCLRVAEGLRAAHQSGVLHRDIKPDNILVSDRAPFEAYVADFGLARLEENTTPSRSGTPAFMSPEQANGKPLSALSDQYSFAATFHEAFERADAPGWAREALKRALEAEPAARFSSMDDLIDALAYDPTRARRNRVTAIAGVGLLVSTLGVAVWFLGQPGVCARVDGAMDSVWPAERASVLERFQSDDAIWLPAAGDAIDAAFGRWASTWREAARAACESAQVARTRSSELYDLQMECLEQQRLAGASLVGAIRNATLEELKNAPKAATELPRAKTCTDATTLRRRVPKPQDPKTRNEINTVEGELADARASLHLRKAPGQDLDALLERAEATEWQPLIANALFVVGLAAELEGEHDLARARLEDALWEGLAARADRSVAEAGVRLTWIESYWKRNRKLAERWDRATTAALDAAEDPRLRGRLIDFRGVRAALAKEYESAVALHREAIETLDNAEGEHALATLRARTNLAVAYYGQGNHEQAYETFGELAKLVSENIGDRHPLLGPILTNRGGLAVVLKKWHVATEVLEQALAIKAEALGEDHPSLASTYTNLGESHAMIGETRKADALFERAIALSTKEDPNHPRSISARLNQITNALGADDGRALALTESLLVVMRRLHADGGALEHPDAFPALALRAQALLRNNRQDEAKPLLATLENHAGRDSALDVDRFEVSLAAFRLAPSEAKRVQLTKNFQPLDFVPHRRQLIAAELEAPAATP